MKTFLEQAEERLMAELHRTGPEDGSGFCLHIKGGALTDNDFTRLPEWATHWIGHHEDGKILICHDRDVFIFSPNLTMAAFMELREKFCESFKNTDAGTISWYDPRINGAGLTELAQAKRERRIAIQKKAQEAARLHNREKRREDIMQAPLNAELVETLSRRRDDRSKLNIMVVEDDPFSRKLVGNSLSTQYALTFAEDGKSAIFNHLKAAPDIVFLDIDLPDITGHDVLHRILEIDPAAFVVMLSGNGNLDNIMRAVNAGAKGFVAKPFTKEKLLQYIGKCPRNNSQHQAGV